MYLAYKFLQDGDNTKGLMARHYPPLSKLTESRISFEDAIDDTGDVDKAITNIAINNADEIASYVQHNGEVPSPNPIVAFIQAVFIRMKHIAYVASSTDTPDIEALHLIEDEETQNVELNTSDGEYVLGSDVQAAIKKAIEYVKGMRIEAGLSPRLCEIIGEICSEYDDTDAFAFFDYFGDITQGDPLYNKEYWNDATIVRNSLYPDARRNNADGGFLTTVLEEIKKIVGKVGDSVIKPVTSDIASDSLKAAIKRNLPAIVGLILLLGAVIYLSIYAARKQS